MPTKDVETILRWADDHDVAYAIAEAILNCPADICGERSADDIWEAPTENEDKYVISRAFSDQIYRDRTDLTENDTLH